MRKVKRCSMRDVQCETKFAALQGCFVNGLDRTHGFRGLDGIHCDCEFDGVAIHLQLQPCFVLCKQSHMSPRRFSSCQCRKTG